MRITPAVMNTEYINKVSTVTTFNKYGVPCRYVDEDLKAEVQMKYLIELSKCEVK